VQRSERRAGAGAPGEPTRPLEGDPSEAVALRAVEQGAHRADERFEVARSDEESAALEPPSSSCGNGLAMVATTGAPQAAASTAGSPNPSFSEGSNKARVPVSR
jgi:hypothetical protein